MKYYFLGFILALFGNTNFISAQELNVFLSEPHEIQSFLKGKYQKIELSKLVREPRGRFMDTTLFKTIKFSGDSLCLIIDKLEEDYIDTTFYKFDKCSHLVSKRGRFVNNTYKNIEKSCQLIASESTEMEFMTGTLFHEMNYNKYFYNKDKKCIRLLVCTLSDTSVLKSSTEYTYKGNNPDSVNTYYYQDGEKKRNRVTKYFYSDKLDSFHIYNFDFYLIDRAVYKYDLKGNLMDVLGERLGTFKYHYKANEDPFMLTEERLKKSFFIKYYK